MVLISLNPTVMTNRLQSKLKANQSTSKLIKKARQMTLTT